MTVLISPDTLFINATPAVLPDTAHSGVLDYCTTTADERAHAKLRDLTALETIYAYYGSDEVAL